MGRNARLVVRKLRYFNMSTPSLPMDPQCLEMALGVKRALSYSALRKMEDQMGRLVFFPYVVIRAQVTTPFSALPAQTIWPANETVSHDPASATCSVGIVHYLRELVQSSVHKF